MVKSLDVDIRCAAAEREAFFSSMYEKTFPWVAKFVSHRNGRFEDAKDIFHDALITFYEKTLEGKRSQDISDHAYVCGIAKHLWIKKFNSEKKNILLDEWETLIEIPDDQPKTTESDKLLRVLQSAGEKCLNLLTDFYFEKISLGQIADKFGFGSVRSATVQKFKCLEKMRDVVKSKSLRHEDFFE